MKGPTSCFLVLSTQLMLTAIAAPARHALFWLGPYSTINTTAGYEKVWHQWADNWRPGYIAAGSAFAVKHNGSIGFADTNAGEGLEGVLMAQYGFPALKKLNLTTLGMVYVTHTDGIAKILAQPAQFVSTLVGLAETYNLDGFDLDYEPQAEPYDDEKDEWRVIEGLRSRRCHDQSHRLKHGSHSLSLSERNTDTSSSRSAGTRSSGGNPAEFTEMTSFMSLVSQLTAALKPSGRIVTIDVSGCPSSVDFHCTGAVKAGLVHVNTMDSFSAGSPSDLQALEGTDSPPLNATWSPGFEPAGLGQSGWAAMTSYMASRPHTYRGLSTWGAGQPGSYDQPQWFFDAVNAFLDATDVNVD